MSVLFPRLLDRAATGLFAEYGAIGDIETLAQRAAVRHPSAVYAATGGRRVTQEELTALREEVLRLARDSGYPALGSPAARVGFDLQLARTLHTTMNVVPAEASVRAMWAFLALIVLPDVAFWRFPDPPKDRMLATDITRHAFGRLWWRAHLLHDPSRDDPYLLLDTFGEAAFDQIFARRRALGGSRALIRGLAMHWHSFDLGSQSERDVLRDTLKRLLRHGAFQEYESLDDGTIRDELESLVRETVVGLGG